MSEPTMLEQLLEAIQQAKTVIREAHEATKDLRQTTKEAREIMRTLVREEFEPRLNEEINRASEQISQHAVEAAETYSQKMIDRFDRLTNLLMFGNEQGRGEGLEPAIRKVASERHLNGGAV